MAAVPAAAGGAQAYIAVPDHLVDAVLTDGYATTRRTHVPCNLDPRRGCEAMLQYHKEEHRIVALEVRDVGDMLEISDRGTRLNTKHLHPRHLSLGSIEPPDAHVPHGGFDCPHCPKTNLDTPGIHVFFGV